MMVTEENSYAKLPSAQSPDGESLGHALLRDLIDWSFLTPSEC